MFGVATKADRVWKMLRSRHGVVVEEHGTTLPPTLTNGHKVVTAKSTAIILLTFLNLAGPTSAF